LIVDLMYRGGLGYMRYSVSHTAEQGDYIAGDKIIGPESRAAMKALLSDIQSGEFARAWIEENAKGLPEFTRRRHAEREHLLERVGQRLRAMMPFVDPITIQPGDGES